MVAPLLLLLAPTPLALTHARAILGSLETAILVMTLMNAPACRTIAMTMPRATILTDPLLAPAMEAGWVMANSALISMNVLVIRILAHPPQRARIVRVRLPAPVTWVTLVAASHAAILLNAR